MKQEQRIKNTRAKIYAAAAACFAENGYEGCSMDGIASRAGLSKGALYSHFQSKAALFVAIICNEHDRAAARAASEALTPPYVEGIIRYMSQCIRDSGFPMDHRLWTEVLAVAARNPEIKKIFIDSERKSRAVLRSLIEKAILAGEIDAGCDAESLSILIFSLGDGLIARIADDPTFDFQKMLPTLARAVRGLLGVRPAPAS